jgi:hypothetical protein
MDESAIKLFLNPVIQYGFAGLCVLLLAFIFWMTKRLLGVLEKNSEVIVTNTNAIHNVQETMTETKDLTIEVKDILNQRPCIKGAIKSGSGTG